LEGNTRGSPILLRTCYPHKLALATKTVFKEAKKSKAHKINSKVYEVKEQRHRIVCENLYKYMFMEYTHTYVFLCTEYF
jgi:hypothetical protein